MMYKHAQAEMLPLPPKQSDPDEEDGLIVTSHLSI